MSHKMFTINNTPAPDASESIPLQVSDFTSESSSQTGEIIGYDGTACKNRSGGGGSGAFSMGLANYVDDSSGIYISSSWWTSTNGYIPHFRYTGYGNNNIFSNGIAHAPPNTFTSADWESNANSGSWFKHGTVSTAGKYLCICLLGSIKLAYDDLQTLRWVKNGTAFGAYYQVDRYSRRPTTMIAIADCQADDTIGIKFQDNTGNKDLANSDQHKQHAISIFKL